MTLNASEGYRCKIVVTEILRVPRDTEMREYILTVLSSTEIAAKHHLRADNDDAAIKDAIEMLNDLHHIRGRLYRVTEQGDEFVGAVPCLILEGQIIRKE